LKLSLFTLELDENKTHTLLHVYVCFHNMLACQEDTRFIGPYKQEILILGRCSEVVILGWVMGETNRASVGGAGEIWVIMHANAILRLLRKGRGWVGIFRPVSSPPTPHTHTLIVPAPY